MTKQATAAQIREFLQHGEGTRIVRVHRDGRVSYYGSTDDFDRGHDYWHCGRFAAEYRVDESGRVFHR